MIGVVLYDAQQRVPIFHNSHLSREFVDGVLDVVLADRAAQFSFVVGPPALYRGSVAAGTSGSGGNEDGGAFEGNNQQQQQQGDASKRISNSLLHASLLSGVVESQHKIHEQRELAMMMAAAAADGGRGNNARASSSGGGGGFMLGGGQRPPHWPRLVRAPGVSLGRAAISSSCPVLPRNAAAAGSNALPTQLTQRQIHGSKALNEGCVIVAAHPAAPSNSATTASTTTTSASATAHAWLHPSVAPCTTEYAAQWIAAYSDAPAASSSGSGGDAPQQQQQQQRAPTSPVLSGDLSASASLEEREKAAAIAAAVDRARAKLPTTWNFHWRIFGDSFGIVYVIVSYPPSPPAVASSSAATSAPATHEENVPGVKQSMSNLFVLLCEAFKTARSVEAPTSKQLISNLDLVQEVVEIVCPGNGRCMPLFDTAMARKIWKLRNES